jgi:hypothetical protein
MLLICNAYGGTEEGENADFVAVSVTPDFLETLRARQRLAQPLRCEAGVGDLDSLLFREASPQWLSWSEDLEELLHVAEATGWTLAGDDRIAVAESADVTDLAHAVRTDCDFVRVWPERFQFTCCLRNTDTAIQSAMLYFDDFFTAAACRMPALHDSIAA